MEAVKVHYPDVDGTHYGRDAVYHTTLDATGGLREPLVQACDDSDGLVLCWPRRRTWVRVSARGEVEVSNCNNNNNLSVVASGHD